MGVFSFLFYHLINTDMKHLVKVFAMLAIATFTAITFCQFLPAYCESRVHSKPLPKIDVFEINGLALLILVLVTIVTLLAASIFFSDFKEERQRRREGLNYKNTF